MSCSMKLLDSITFMGHHNVRATNSSTLEVTTERHLTLRGDCIIGVAADKACSDLSRSAKAWLQGEGNRAMVRIVVGADTFDIPAYGSRRLTHESNVSMVLRKSEYTCERTLAIHAAFAACNIPQTMVTKLRAGSSGVLEIYALGS